MGTSENTERVDLDEPALCLDSSGTKLYYYRNQQYSIVALTNASGGTVERYAYTAYGEPTILSGSGSPQSFTTYKNGYQYTGREWDEALSLYHYRAGMYSPVAGRFVSRDPIGFEGSEWNLFEYIQNSPLAYLDPLGLAIWVGAPDIPGDDETPILGMGPGNGIPDYRTSLVVHWSCSMGIIDAQETTPVQRCSKKLRISPRRYIPIGFGRRVILILIPSGGRTAVTLRRSKNCRTA